IGTPTQISDHIQPQIRSIVTAMTADCSSSWAGRIKRTWKSFFLVPRPRNQYWEKSEPRYFAIIQKWAFAFATALIGIATELCKGRCEQWGITGFSIWLFLTCVRSQNEHALFLEFSGSAPTPMEVTMTRIFLYIVTMFRN